MQIGHKHTKSTQQYRHNIKLLKYYLKKQQRINETLKYKSLKNQKKIKNQQKTINQPKERIYSMLDTVMKLNNRMKQMGLNLSDIFRMADATYEGQINKGQFLKVVNQLKADIQENLVQQMFYAIDTNLNGILDQDEYLQFLCAYGGADHKDAHKFQKKTMQKFAAQLKKKSTKVQSYLADSMDPISVYDLKKKLSTLSLNSNQVMILLKAFDPQNSGNVNHQLFIQMMKSVKQKNQQTIVNEEMQKDIKYMCVQWRQKKINPIKIFEQADADKKDGISPIQLEEAFLKLMPNETKFNIKKWVKIINLNNDKQITREQFVNSIRAFYALNQLEKFSSDYEKQNPNAKRAVNSQQISIEKIIKTLQEKIQDSKMTKTQAFKSMDINGDGTLNKEELAEGLKKFGFNIVFIGRVLTVFDRNCSEGIQLEQWLKILGEDVQIEDIDIPDDESINETKSPVKKTQIKKQTKKQNQKNKVSPNKGKDVKKNDKKEGKKEDKNEIKKEDKKQVKQQIQTIKDKNVLKDKKDIKNTTQIKQTKNIKEIKNLKDTKVGKETKDIKQTKSGIDNKNKINISDKNDKKNEKIKETSKPKDESKPKVNEKVKQSQKIKEKSKVQKQPSQEPQQDYGYDENFQDEDQDGPKIKMTHSNVVRSDKKIPLKKQSSIKKIQMQSSSKSIKPSLGIQDSKTQLLKMQQKDQKLTDFIIISEEQQKQRKQLLQKAKKLKSKKQKFVDKQFPAQLKSITTNIANSRIDNGNQKVKFLKWKHFSQFYKNPSLYEGGVEPNDIVQGALGNCYFLSSLACLAEYPLLIERLFEYYDLETGYFLIWLCIDGTWKLYEIDGNIVVNAAGTQPYFSHNQKEQLWVPLLEKVYAKAYGCYENIVGGDPATAIRDLSGSPSQTLIHESIKVQQLWKRLYEANINKFIMATGTDVQKEKQKKIEGRQEGVTQDGLVMGHAYSILELHEEGKQKIIQLRNPWGKVEWTGDWSDLSSKWTQKLRKKLNYYSDKQDGIFWMPFSEYFKRYKTTSINFLRPTYIYHSSNQPGVKQVLIKASGSELKQLYLTITQQDHRHNGPVAKEYIRLNMVPLVCQKDKQPLKVVKKLKQKTWKGSRQCQMLIQDIKDAQQMIAIVKLDQETNINVSFYSNCKVDFTIEQLNDQDELKYFQAIAYLDDQSRNQTQDGFEYWSSSVSNKAFLCFKNVKCPKSKVTVSVSDLNNLKILNPQKLGDNVLKIPKGQTKSIRAQIVNMKEEYGFKNFGYFAE